MVDEDRDGRDRPAPRAGGRAVTDESTPPESAQITASGGRLAADRPPIFWSRNDAHRPVGADAADPEEKILEDESAVRRAWRTSGWNLIA